MAKILSIALFITCFIQAEEKKDYPRVLMKTSMGDIEIELYPDSAPETVKNFIELAEGKKEFTDVKTDKKVKRPFYDGLTFHRVIDEFMIQAGCPNANGQSGPGYTFKDEINIKGMGLEKEMAMTEEGFAERLLIHSEAGFQRTILGPLFKKLNINSQEDLDVKKEDIKKAIKALTVKDVYENLGYKYDEKLVSRVPKKWSLCMANLGPNTNGSQFFINLKDTDYLKGKHTVFGKVIKGKDVVEKIGKVDVNFRKKPEKDITIISIRQIKPDSKEEPKKEE